MTKYEQIEAYVSGQMDVETQLAFEQALQTDPQLKAALESWRQTDAIVQKHQAAEPGVQELTRLLQPLTQAHFKAETKGKRVSFKKYWIAASAIAAILVLFFLIPPGIDSYPIPDMPSSLVRGHQEAGKNGSQLFNKGEYEAASPVLKQALEGDPQNAQLQFYYGICQLKTEFPAEALAVFQKLLAGTSAYQEDSYFFAAMSAYHSSQNELAKQYALQVPTQNGYYKNAKRLLTKIP